MQNLLLLHGALGFSTDLSPLVSKLKEENIYPVAIEFSGHGSAEFNAAFSIPQFTKEVQEFILKNNLTGIPVFGYSMGGYVALHTAATHPELLGKIITLGTKFNWNKEAVEKETAQLNPGIIKQKVPAFAKSLKEKHGTKWEELLIRTSALMKDIGEHNYLSNSALPTIKNKVLLGIGDRDKMVSYEETHNVYKHLPYSAMYMLPNSPHPLEKANMEILTELICEFVA